MIRKQVRLMLWILFSIAILSACVTSQTEIAATATQGAVNIITTLTAQAPTAPQTFVPSTVKLIEPGGKIGEMVVRIGRYDSADISSIFNSCSAMIDESDPSVIVRECTVLETDYLFIGYGMFASSPDELNIDWDSYSWELFLDELSVDLPAFETFDDKWESYTRRQWNIAIENPSPGAHTLRYVITSKDSSDEFYDVTWKFTIAEHAAPTTTAITIPSITYPALSTGPQTGQHPYTSQGQLNFLLYVPGDYGKDSSQKWPVILFLHGVGERMDNLEHVRGIGLPNELESQTDFPFIVASPQLIGGASRDYWSHPAVVELLFGLLEEIQTKLSIDPSRVYLTGISLGGGGTWEIGLQYPGHFAALVPVAGYYGYPFGVPDNICDLKDEPIWAFHGAKDEVVPLDAEQGLVDALKAFGGNVQFTVYPEGGHEIWDQAYATPELYTWMLEQLLK